MIESIPATPRLIEKKVRPIRPTSRQSMHPVYLLTTALLNSMDIGDSVGAGAAATLPSMRALAAANASTPERSKSLQAGASPNAVTSKQLNAGTEVLLP